MSGAVYNSRDYYVVKSNELIQKSRFQLSLQEQKAIALICSMIQPIQKEGNNKEIVDWKLEYEFNIVQYCKICGIDYSNGKNYINVKATLKSLSDRSMWLEIGEEEVLVRWLSKVRMNKRSGKVKIEIDRDLAPYLFDLKKRFTQYQLYNILSMNSAFSIRVYEILKSYEFTRKKKFQIDELKHLLMVDNVKSYANFKDFRKYVLDKAIDEINEYTDIQVQYKTIKKGRRVEWIEFEIVRESLINQTIKRHKLENEKSVATF